MDKEIKRLLQQGVIEVTDQKPKCILPLRTLPEKNNKFHLVLDCHHTNSFVDTPKFSEEGIGSVAELIQDGDQLISVDLENGFHRVDVHPSCRTYLGMRWRGICYVWKVLPFGVNCAPFVFNKILCPVVQFLRENNLRVTLFVDDFFQMARPSEVTDHADFLQHTLQDLGWSVNREKSQSDPSTCASFIEFDFHSTGTDGPWISVLLGKIKKLKRLLTKVLSLRNRGIQIKVQMLAKVAGQCIAMMRAVIPAKLLLRNVYRTI